jgi:hypothetical protein
MVVPAAALLALPHWFVLWFLGSLNDKEGGWHPTPWGYLLAGLLSAAAAAIAWGLVSTAVRPSSRVRVYWPVVGLCGCALLVSFCLWWGRWTMEYRDLYGRPTEPPAHER